MALDEINPTKSNTQTSRTLFCGQVNQITINDLSLKMLQAQLDYHMVFSLDSHDARGW